MIDDLIKNISVVLVKTSHPGNIGSAARAMKTMGLNNLILVSPKDFPSDKAKALASGAGDLLDNAKVVDNLDEALAGHHLIIATSARMRNLSLPYLTPAAAAKTMLNFIVQNPGGENKNCEDKSCENQKRVAILFGEERIGLENDALSRAHYHLVIPTSQVYSSLNLSQAVQVVCYACREQAIDVIDAINQIEPVKENLSSQDELADGMQVGGLMEHLNEVMIKTEFIDSKQPKQLLLRITRVFQRARLSVREVNILRGICSAVLKKI